MNTRKIRATCKKCIWVLNLIYAFQEKKTTANTILSQNSEEKKSLPCHNDSSLCSERIDQTADPFQTLIMWVCVYVCVC